MRQRSLIRQRKTKKRRTHGRTPLNRTCEGSITVFLSFLLIFLASFIFTTLEGARIKASEAMLGMITEMAGNSALGGYYYPLFKEYGLLAVDGGFGKKEYSVSSLEKEMNRYLTCFYDTSEGGLLSGNGASLKIRDTKTLLTDEMSGLRAQIKEEAMFEGAELILDVFTENEMFKSAGVLKEVYDKQAEAMEAAAAVTKEVLNLMTLIDGVLTTDTGLFLLEEGEPKAAESFLKQLGLKDEAYMRSTYGNPRIYSAVRPGIICVTDLTDRFYSLMSDIDKQNDRIASQEKYINILKDELETLDREILELSTEKVETEEALKVLRNEIKELKTAIKEIEASKADEEPGSVEAKETPDPSLISLTDFKEWLKVKENTRDQLLEHLELIKMDMEEKCGIQKLLEEAVPDNEEILDGLYAEKEKTVRASADLYGTVSRVISRARDNSKEAMKCLALLKVKQEAAKAVADGYAGFLEETEGLPGEVLEGLLEDTVNLKAYVTLEKSGYDTDKMLQNLGEDMLFLSKAALPQIDSHDTVSMEKAIRNAEDWLGEMNYDHLKFNYGGIKAGDDTGKNVKNTLKEAMAGGLLKYLGVTEVSDKKLNGQDLPSGGEWGEKEEDIFEAFSKMSDFLENCDPAETLKQAGEELGFDLMTEVWMANHFSDLTDPGKDTMLEYEREYVLSGKESDALNLASAALKLAAFRTVFTFASLLADGERTGEATVLAASVTGITGIPALLYVVKYAILTVWAMEEALVEVSALLMGRKVPVFYPAGRIQISEILTMTGSRVKEKAETIGVYAPGIDYLTYITLLSFFEGLEKKELRIADLIQENLRLKYRDSFRIKNAVTFVAFSASVTAEQRFKTGFFVPQAYVLSTEKEISY